MKLLKKLTFIFFLAMLSQSVFAKLSDIPVKDFFKNPEFTNLQLSPNGKYLAVMSPINDRRNIVIMEVDSLKNVRALTGLSKQNVAGFFWANNDNIVFTLDSDGNEAFSLFVVNTTGKTKIKELVGSSVGASGIRSASVVHTLPEDPDHILVQFNGRIVKAPDLYKLPLKSRWNKRRKKNNKMKIIAKNPGDVQSWIVDHDGDVRGAVSLSGIRGKFHYKNKGEKKFRVLREFNILEEGISPLTFDYDNKTMYVSSNINRDRNAIYKFDPEKNELGEMVYGHDVVDVSGLIMSRKQKKVLGVSYFDDYPTNVYFDEAIKKQLKELSNAFPNKKVNISSQTKDEMLQILLVNDDQDPGNYYLYDKKNRQSQVFTISHSVN